MKKCMSQNNFDLKASLWNQVKFNDFEKLIQVIPLEMMNFIEESAKTEGWSLDEEVVIRLLATFADPNVFGCSVLFDTLMNLKFTEVDAKAESEARQKGWMYVYQRQKLRLYVELEGKLPKKFKENFLIENLDEEMQKIREEIKAEEEQSKKNGA